LKQIKRANVSKRVIEKYFAGSDLSFFFV